MKEKLTIWMKNRSYNSHALRLLVGGYIAYLGIRVLLDLYAEEAFALPLVLGAVLLILAGAPIALISLYALLKFGQTPASHPEDPDDELSEE